MKSLNSFTDRKKKETAQMVEIWIMMERGEVTRDYFLKAFYYRFGSEIRRERTRQFQKNGYGWKDIDWSKVEANIVLKQLLPESDAHQSPQFVS